MSFEDCIDVVKDWVIAQAYATEAWVEAKVYATRAWVQASFYTQAEVEEWVEPMHVSGTLDPDVTCTYHKAGAYGGKPYYIRDDGEWYIWWDTGVSIWIISPGTGVVMGPHWRRNDPNIEGNYVVAGGAAGVATVTASYGCPHRCFIDRGDPANPDFLIGDLTDDFAWRDLDLSGIIPAGAKGVTLGCIIANSVINKNLMIRKNGNANTANAGYLNCQIANITKGGDITCPLDDNRKVEYRLTAGTWLFVSITVKEWWF